MASGRPGARCLPVLVPLPEDVTVWAAAAGAHVCDALVAAQHLRLPGALILPPTQQAGFALAD